MMQVKQKTKNLLLWMQKKFQINTLYLAKGGFWISSGFLLTSVLSLVQVVIFANFLPKEVYGSYKYILALAGSFAFMTLTGMNDSVTQASGKGASSKILSYSVKVQLKWNLLYSITMIGLSTYYFLNHNLLFAKSLFVLGIAFPLDTTFNTYGAFLLGKKDFKRASVYGTVTPSLQIIALAVGALLTKDIFVLISIYSLTGFLPNLFFYIKTLRLYKFEVPIQDDKEGVKKFGKQLTFLHILSGIAQYVDKIVIFHYLGAVQLAVYGLAQAVPERVRGYIKTLSGLILPKLSSKNVEEIDKTFHKRVFQGMALGAAMSIAYIVLAPAFYRLFFPKYLESITYSQIFSLTLIFALPASYMSGAFNAHKMLRTLYFSSLGSSIVRIILYIALGKFFGIWGVIGAILVVYAAGTVYNFYLWEMELRNRSKDRGGKVPIISEPDIDLLN